MKSALFVLEGPDGVGKSTLAAKLSDELNLRGFSSKLFSLPGRERGTLGHHVYNLYHTPSVFGVDKIFVTSEQLLFTAAHADVIQGQILPALSSGMNVILDRYWWSTWVYATVGGLDPKIRNLLIKIEHILWRRIQPNCIFLIQREQPTDSEHTPAHWRQLVSLYRSISAREKKHGKIVVVDNSAQIREATDFILARLGCADERKNSARRRQALNK
jgi:thymidylate kinase